MRRRTRNQSDEEIIRKLRTEGREDCLYTLWRKKCNFSDETFHAPRLCEHNYRRHGAFSREEMAGGRCRAGFVPVKPSNAPDPSRKRVPILYLQTLCG